MSDKNKNKNKKEKSFVDRIVEHLQEEEVKMRPKSYFVFKIIFSILATIAITIFVVYLVSFIFFVLRVTGIGDLPAFGLEAIDTFIGYLPWILILASLILIGILQLLVKRFSFAYKQPLIYLLIGIILLVSIGSFVVDNSKIHPRLLKKTQENRVPVAKDFYHDYAKKRPLQVCKGLVSKVEPESVYVKEFGNGLVRIIFVPHTKFLNGRGIKKGEVIVVLGKKAKNGIKALKVRKVENSKLKQWIQER